MHCAKHLDALLYALHLSASVSNRRTTITNSHFNAYRDSARHSYRYAYGYSNRNPNLNADSETNTNSNSRDTNTN
jgi:hypothetical protein